jgi:hypothetical protein
MPEWGVEIYCSLCRKYDLHMDGVSGHLEWQFAYVQYFYHRSENRYGAVNSCGGRRELPVGGDCGEDVDCASVAGHTRDYALGRNGLPECGVACLGNITGIGRHLHLDGVCRHGQRLVLYVQHRCSWRQDSHRIFKGDGRRRDLPVGQCGCDGNGAGVAGHTGDYALGRDGIPECGVACLGNITGSRRHLHVDGLCRDSQWHWQWYLYI